jgi:hypothetical protein
VATPAVAGLTINGAGNNIIGTSVLAGGTNNWRATKGRCGPAAARAPRRHFLASRCRGC